MARRRRRSRGEAWKVVGAGLLIAVCLTLVAGYVMLRASVSDRPVLNRESLCPINGARSVVVVLLDATDNLPDITRKEVQVYLSDLSQDIPDYSRLELRLLDPQMAGGRVVFSKCNPGDGSNLSEIVGNPKIARKRWLDQFREPLDKALSESLRSPDAKSSPILATLQQIAVDRFSTREARSIPKSLVIVSDMIEFTNRYEQYRQVPNYEMFRKTDAYKLWRTDLHGANVTIKYIVRLGRQLDTGRHIQFWIDWVRDNNGNLKLAEKLQGAG